MLNIFSFDYGHGNRIGKDSVLYGKLPPDSSLRTVFSGLILWDDVRLKVKDYLDTSDVEVSSDGSGVEYKPHSSDTVRGSLFIYYTSSRFYEEWGHDSTLPLLWVSVLIGLNIETKGRVGHQ